jgi:hypothetical protein
MIAAHAECHLAYGPSDDKLRADCDDLVGRNVEKLGWIIGVALQEDENDVLPEGQAFVFGRLQHVATDKIARHYCI